MKKKFEKRKFYTRVICIYLVLSLFFQVTAPTVALALTSGPSQPEVQSFEPVEANTMVNSFSGDFTYNIPLLTVPGPNGGYPVNLSYHAGATMEEEASWTGLGWNINPGVISRNVRGVPDDFNGEKITKEMNQKVHRIFSLGGGFSNEYFGYSHATGSLGAVLNFDNYKGLTLAFNANFNSRLNSKLRWGIDLNFDPVSGVGLQPTASIGNKNMVQAGFSYSSRHGMTDISLKLSRRIKKTSGRYGVGTSFISVASVPHQNLKFGGVDFSFQAKFGTEIIGNHLNAYGKIGYKQIKLKTPTLNTSAYGYLNYQYHQDDEDALYDYNKDNNGPPAFNAPALDVPVATYDIYQATGQGLAATFRPFRSDLGVFYDPSIRSNYDDVNGGYENGWTPLFVPCIPALHLGFNVNNTFSQSYSGRWQRKDDDVMNYLKYVPEISSYDPTNDYAQMPSTYFKDVTEMTTNASSTSNELDRLQGTAPIAFDFSMGVSTFVALEPTAHKNTTSTSGDAFTYVNRQTVERRSTNFHYRKLSEVKDDITATSAKYIYALGNNFPTTSTGSDIYNSSLAFSGADTNHIAEISVYKEDGMKYVYGLPVYNTAQKEVYFNLQSGHGNVTTSKYKTWSNYNQGSASTGNSDGEDHFFSSTSVPPYAHSYMLTAIYSPDYVDLTGDGPTEDDFGYYTKFNYTRLSGYQWRTPFIGANLDKGENSNTGDDKGSYMCGTKEVYYLNSIETKSHIALFYTSDRLDARGSGGELQVAGNNLTGSTDPVGSQYQDHNKLLQRLDSITLLSKEDLAKTIKKVILGYNYSLCRNVINNTKADFTATSTTADTLSGKLTLARLYFTNSDNRKGSLTPYRFTYDVGGTYDNPDYDPSSIDRWGGFKPDGASGPNNQYYPYVSQSDPNNFAYAGAWNLKRIEMPSGATMNVNYEADDYAYVQNLRAMQMFTINHTGSSSDYTSATKSLKDGYDRLYFTLPHSVASQTELNALGLTDGIDKLYFKAFVNMKKKPDFSTEDANDYIDGYCNINRDGLVVQPSGNFPTSEAFIQVRFVSASKTDDNNGKIHPFRKAAFEYMKLKRPDLFFPTTFTGQNANIGVQFVYSIINFFKNIEELFTGYYDACRINGYAGGILVNGMTDYKPTMIRLNNDNYKKIGGGHRVSKITIQDNWNAMTTTSGNEAGYTYGQEYKYIRVDGKSSGVAEYEPLIGGEEIPLRLPSDKYSAESKSVSRQKEFYAEEPYGEAYFPAANVGYSRVVVKNIDPPDPYGTGGATASNSKSKNGIAVHEFYTAKDFPISISKTDVTTKKNNFSILIPFIGSKSSSTAGHSQGFTIELNDMHGKPKGDATYSYNYYADLIHSGTNPNPNPPYISKTEAIYNTLATYNPNGVNVLKSSVPVLEADGQPMNKDMGVTYDFSTMMNEDADFSLGTGVVVNISEDCPIPPIPTSPFNLELSETMTRTMSTCKLITRKGVLMQTKSYNNGSVAINKNLAFDAATGTPVLVSMTNEFDKPVYKYDYSAHWYYPGMKNNGDRYRWSVRSLHMTTSGSLYNLTCTSTTVDFNQVFHPGDVVYLQKTPVAAGQAVYARVINVNTSSIDILPESIPGSLAMSSLCGTSIFLKATISKPIESNQQSISSGYITSLQNPTLPEVSKCPLWSSLNAAIIGHPFTSSQIPYTYIDSCNASFDGLPITYNAGNVSISANTLIITFYGPGSTQSYALQIQTTSMPFTSSGGTVFNANNYRFYYVSPTQVKIVDITNGSTEIASIVANRTTFVIPPPCKDADIIRASATTYTNNLSGLLDYNDVGDPFTILTNTSSSPSAANISANAGVNPYRFGQKGVWKQENTFTWLSPRKQGATQTNIAVDGPIGNFMTYPWTAPSTANNKWNLVSSVTLYNPYGFEVENRDVLNNYSSSIYGYSNQLATSVAANAGYYEQGFDGFEDYPTTSISTTNSGHFKFAYGGGGSLVLSSGIAHTGQKSLQIGTGSQLQYANIPAAATTSTKGTGYGLNLMNSTGGKQYIMTFWVKNIDQSNFSGYVGATGASSVSSNISDYQIEGWRRVELLFTTNGSPITVSIGSSSVTSYIDDVRLQPFQSSQKTYVYNPNTLWLVAELDERNFATFYNYDEEGSLVQVKKETVNGIVTVKTSRQNIFIRP